MQVFFLKSLKLNMKLPLKIGVLNHKEFNMKILYFDKSKK